MPVTKRKPPRPEPGRVCRDCGGASHTEVYCSGLGKLKCQICKRPQKSHAVGESCWLKGLV